MRELLHATVKGNLNGVKEIFKGDVDIQAKNSALRLAADYGYLDIVKYLVEQGADIHVKQDDAYTCAVYNGHIDVINYLKSKGAKETELYQVKAAEDNFHRPTRYGWL